MDNKRGIRSLRIMVVMTERAKYRKNAEDGVKGWQYECVNQLEANSSRVVQKDCVEKLCRRVSRRCVHQEYV